MGNPVVECSPAPTPGGKPRRRLLLTLAMLCAPIVVFLLALIVYTTAKALAIRDLAPPSTVRNVEAFVHWDDASDLSFSVFERGGHRYFEARRRPPGWMIPSGYTCYVFDASGAWVAWTWDNWDDPSWKQTWGEEEGRESISLEQVLNAIRDQTSTR